jgi:hypothetical protein
MGASIYWTSPAQKRKRCLKEERTERGVWKKGRKIPNYRSSIEGKNLGPAKPWATTLWISMFPPLNGLHSFIRINLPDLDSVIA